MVGRVSVGLASLPASPSLDVAEATSVDALASAVASRAERLLGSLHSPTSGQGPL